MVGALYKDAVCSDTFRHGSVHGRREKSIADPAAMAMSGH